MTTGHMRSTLAAFALVTLVVLPATVAAQQRAKDVPIHTSSAPRFERPQTPASLGVHGFSVVLVVGGVGAPAGASASENVPEAARKALADMKDFLPYKRYQLLDAAWILCCAPNTTQVSGRVRGPDGRDYLYTVDPGGIVGSKLNLRFVMREVQEFSPVKLGTMSDTTRLEFMKQQTEASRELDESEIHLRTIQQRFQVGTATPSEMESATARVRRAQQRAQDLQRMVEGGQPRSGAQGGGARSTVAASAVVARGGGGRGSTTFGRETMDSSFSISPGETVVIGTSRISGDQALIAILTAATKPGSSR